jgi:hypothetical protein
VSNVHNSHLWGWENLHAIREHGYQVCFNVSVWAVIVGDIVVGLCPLPDRLTAQRYRDYVETFLPELLEDMPLAVRKRFWFQQDGAPAHYGEDVRQWLKATFPGRWIGSGGTISWLPLSPELTPMIFFPVGAPEEPSLRSPSQDFEDLVASLQETVTTVDANMLRRVRENAVRRTAVCLEMDRGRFEHLF